MEMTKIKLTITIDSKVLEEFREVCKNNDIKMSTKINSLIMEWIKKNAIGNERNNR